MKKFKEMRKCTECNASPCKCVKEEVKADHDTHMTINYLKSTVMNSEKILGMIKSDDELPEWCHAKITMAQDYIDTVANYIAAEMS